MMGTHINIKPRLVKLCSDAMSALSRIFQDERLSRRYFDEARRREPDISVKDALTQIQQEHVGFAEMQRYLPDAQTIIFSAEQAEVFRSVTRDYVDGLDFRLPFQSVVLQFSKPVPVPLMNRFVSDEPTTDHLMAIILHQRPVDEKFFADMARTKAIMESDPYNLLHIPQRFLDAKSGYTNRAVAIWSDWNHSRFGWLSDSPYELANDAPETDIEAKVQESWAGIKRLAVACIGYINCENIYLHREGEVAEAINAKRERKGKSRLEPYYICRIRGVQYDKTEATGQGSAHSIRYDVRGHFRRLTNGKTTWVRPHQRGLANELYVPKTYLVDRRNA